MIDISKLVEILEKIIDRLGRKLTMVVVTIYCLINIPTDLPANYYYALVGGVVVTSCVGIITQGVLDKRVNRYRENQREHKPFKQGRLE